MLLCVCLAAWYVMIVVWRWDSRILYVVYESGIFSRTSPDQLNPETASRSNSIFCLVRVYLWN